MKTWQAIYELGEQQAQRCQGCGKRVWVERRRLRACPECGGELKDRMERRQGCKSGFRTRKDAETALNDILGTIQNGTYVQPAKMTLAEFLEQQWLPAITPTIRSTTLVGYKCLVSAHLIPGLGSTPLQKLTPSAINTFYGKLLSEPRVSRKKQKAEDKTKKPADNGQEVEDKGKKPEDERQKAEKPKPLTATTVRHIHTTLHRALRDAMRWGLIQRNPADAADPPALRLTEANEMKTWSAKELKSFLEKTKDDRLHPLWRMLASTGMRRGEALGLRWADVDLEAANPSLMVRQALVAAGYKVAFSEPKTKRGRRTIWLDAQTVEALRVWREAQDRERKGKPELWTETGLVFTRESGIAWHPDRISKLFEEAVSASGLPRIRLHDLRHTHATIALGASIHPKVVSDRLGHSTVSFTLDVYSHCIPALAQDAADKIAELVAAAD
jgi:integrase